MASNSAPISTRLSLTGVGLLIGALVVEALLQGRWADSFIYVHPHFVSRSLPNSLSHNKSDNLDADFDRQIGDALLAPAIELSAGAWGYGLKPNFEGRFLSSDFDVSFRTNSSGLRGPKLKATANSQLLALGDSFTMGFGVDEDEIYHSLLSRRLSMDLQEPLESINAGVAGYNPYNSYEAYVHLIGSSIEFDPRLVVLQLWIGDDLCGPSTPARPAPPGSEDTIQRFKALLRQSRVAMLLRDTLRNITPIRRALMDRGMINRTLVHSVLTRQFADKCSEELSALGKLLLRFKEVSEQRGIRFIVILIPMQEQVHPEDWKRAIAYSAIQVDPAQIDIDAPNRAFDGLAKRHGIELLDPVGLLREKAGDGRLYFESLDPHLNAAGHAVVAQALYLHLATSYSDTDSSLH